MQNLLPNWLEPVGGLAGCNPHFKQEMEKQLAKEALELAQIDLREGFVLMPAEEPIKLQYDSNNIGYIEADVVGPDGWGEPAVIAWADDFANGERVFPDESSAASESRKLHFWWHVFPVEELQSRYMKAGEKPDPLTTQLPFDVWKQSFAWPDIWLEIRTEQPALPRGLQRLEAFLEEKRSSWNSESQNGIIHNFAKTQMLDKNRFQFYVDFGSAPEEALVYWLDALAEAPLGAVITEVYVRGFPK